MILTKDKILKLIKKKKVIVEPYKPENVGAASIDLTLSSEFRIYTGKTKTVDIKETTDYKKITQEVSSKQVILKPGDFVIGISEETITLPENIAGILTGRSRFARLGLAIHATASFIQPGVNNKQVFEIKNVSPNDLVLHPGQKICQLVLLQTKGKAKYEGLYKGQVKP